uniref:FYVE-type domain-containing protein n=1 Tax=Hyaloperonospora arabidopsidis (strain Emoy2) TaxID=559515 RepID=M4BX58_HYAAE
MITKTLESCKDHEARVAGYHPQDAKSWQDVARDSDLSIARQKQGAITTTRTFGNVAGDFHRFMEFFSSETSEQLFAWNQFFFGCAVDAVVLCNLNLDDQDNQASLGIKWTCMQPSMLTRKRDECFLEYMGFRKDDQGRNVAVIVRLPVEIPECPPLPDELKTKRERVTTVSIVRASDSHPNATQVFILSHCDHKGLIASTKYCKKLLKALKDVSLSSDAKRIATALSTPGFLEQSQVGTEAFTMGDTIRPWVPSAGVQRGCASCSRPFRGGHRRHHCQMCGDDFCSKCLVRRASVRRRTNTVGNSAAMTSQRTFRVVQSTFCKVCISRTCEEDADAGNEQIGAARRSVVSSRSSLMPRRSSIEQPAIITPASSVSRSSVSQQTDAVFSNATWSEDTRTSWWSENDADACSWKSGSSRFSRISRNHSGIATVRSSISSDYSMGRNSILQLQSHDSPQEIGTVHLDDRIDERSSIYEVIDTKDMMRDQQPEALNGADDDFFSMFPDTVRARYSSTPATPTTLPRNLKSTRSFKVTDSMASSKSLDQCIAEQNELLQQVLSASRILNTGVPPRNKVSPVTESIHEGNDDSQDDGVFEL